MSKTRKWPTRVLYLAIALALVVGLAGIAAPGATSAASGTSEWKDMTTPSEDGWVIAPEFNITGIGLGAGSSGLVYYVTGKNADGAQLLVSKDGGATWKSLTDKVLKVDELKTAPEPLTFARVSVASDDADFLIVVVADGDGALYVVGSVDGGAHFENTGDLSDGDTELTAIRASAISKDIGGGNHMIALGGSGTDANGNIVGLVYRMESGAAFGGNWEDATTYDGWQFTAPTAVFNVWGADSGILHATESAGAFTDEWEGEDLVVDVTTAFVDGGDALDEVFTITYTDLSGDDTQTVEVTIPMGAPAGTIVGPLGVTAIDVTNIAVSVSDATAGAFTVSLADSDLMEAAYDVTVGFTDEFEGEGLYLTDTAPLYNEVYEVEYRSVTDLDLHTDTLEITSGGAVTWNGDTDVLDITNISTAPSIVSKVAFAPSFAKDDTVLALTHTSDGATCLQTGVWGTRNRWNEAADRGAPVLITGVPWAGAAPGTGLALPSDYDRNDRVLWVYVNVTDVGAATGTSNHEAGSVIFRVDGESADPIDKQIPGNALLASVAYSGTIDSGKAMVGLSGAECCEGVQVYRNDTVSDMDICCERWYKACKPPTGVSAAQVMFVGADKAVCVVAGDTPNDIYDESAFSVSYDNGDTWNQVGLVDTNIDYLSDVAKSPNCNKTWVVSVNEGWERTCGCDSLWLKADPLPEAEEYSGKWVRVWCGALESDYGIGLIRLAPEETEESLTVYLVDWLTDTIYYNSTEGWACWETSHSTIDEIVDLAVESASTIYALGADGDVSKSTNNGDDWEIGDEEESVDSNVGDGWTIAVWGTGEDAKVLVGGQSGIVSYSDDAGASFSKMEEKTPVEGYVNVAFDSYFDQNSIVYAAVIDYGEISSGEDGGGIYSWVIDESDSWKDLEAVPTNCQLGVSCDSETGCDEIQVGYTGIVLDRPGNPMTSAATGGVLYATYVYAVVEEDDDDDQETTLYTGVARSLTPATELVCEKCREWDYLHQGLSGDELFVMPPRALKICGCLTPETSTTIWALNPDDGYDMEKGEEALWYYVDCLSKSAPTLLGPADGDTIPADPCYCWNDAFTLKWDRQCDACSYNIQIARDADFTELVLNISGKYEDTCDENDYTPESGTTPSYVVENMALGTGSCGTTYYWRVRSADAQTDEIIHSPWSEVRSFTIGIGAAAAIELTNPSNGATNVPITGVVFTWKAVPDADGYDFTLTDAAGATVDSKTGITGTSYTLPDDKLTNDAAYTWQVNAMKDGKLLSASQTSTFRTAPEAPTPPPVEKPTTPTWVWVVIGLGAVLVIVVVVLIFRTRRV